MPRALACLVLAVLLGPAAASAGAYTPNRVTQSGSTITIVESPDYSVLTMSVIDGTRFVFYDYSKSNATPNTAIDGSSIPGCTHPGDEPQGLECPLAGVQTIDVTLGGAKDELVDDVQPNPDYVEPGGSVHSTTPIPTSVRVNVTATAPTAQRSQSSEGGIDLEGSFTVSARNGGKDEIDCGAAPLKPILADPQDVLTGSCGAPAPQPSPTHGSSSPGSSPSSSGSSSGSHHDAHHRKPRHRKHRKHHR